MVWIPIKTFGWPMDEGRYDLDSYDHECLLYYLTRSYGKYKGRITDCFSALFLPPPAIGQVN